MMNSAKNLIGYSLQAIDGEVGLVREFFFDDHRWIIRYLVADPEGHNLRTSKVLLSPYALGSVDSDARTIGVNLSMAKIASSPGLSSDKPVSRQFEEDYFEYYKWPPYWGGAYGWGYYPYIEKNQPARNGPPQSSLQWDPNLRSTHEVSGYHVEATDGSMGHVKDFVFDDETWAIRYLVVATRNWLSGRVVLISPQWIDRITWPESKVYVNHTKDEIKRAPKFDENLPLSREYESELYLHYNRQGYWVDEQATRDHLIQRDTLEANDVRTATL